MSTNAPRPEPFPAPLVRPAPVVRLVATPPRTRCSDAERNHVVEQLQVHYVDGRLRLNEYEARVDAALGATYVDELPRLLAELPPVLSRRLPSARRHRHLCRGRVLATTLVGIAVTALWAAMLSLPYPAQEKVAMLALLCIPTLAAFALALALPCPRRR